MIKWAISFFVVVFVTGSCVNRATQAGPSSLGAGGKGDGENAVVQRGSGNASSTSQSFSEAFPSIKLPAELQDKDIRRLFREEGYTLREVKSAVGTPPVYSLREQLANLPLLKVDLLYPGMVDGSLKFEIIDSAAINTDTLRGWVFPIVNRELLEEHGLDSLLTNVKVGDRIHFSFFAPRTPPSTETFRFSKENAFSWVAVPADPEPGRVYQATVDIPRAIAAEDELDRARRKGKKMTFW